MSTPVPFSIAHPQQTYRLLELPPDLLALLTSSKDEKPKFLHLKSSSPASTTRGAGSNDSTSGSSSSIGSAINQVYLCTETQSWAIRQVSTSNSVHVTTPVITKDEPTTTATTTITPTSTTTTTTTTIAAVAKPTSHLELIGTITSAPPLPTEETSSSPWLKEIIQKVKTLVPTAAAETDRKQITKEGVISALPYPRAWIERAMSDLFTFTVPATIATTTANTTTDKPKRNDGLAIVPGSNFVYLPSPELLVDAWVRFTRAAATAIKTDIEIVDVLGDDGHVLRVIEEMITPTNGQGEDEDEENDENNNAIAAGVIRSVLTRFGYIGTRTQTQAQPQALVLCLGRCLLKAQAQTGSSSSIPIPELMSKWTALVPLSWERYCIVEELGRGVRIRKSEKIASASAGARTSTSASASHEEAAHTVFWDSSDDADREMDQTGKGTGGSGKTNGGGNSNSNSTDKKKRKWHDMFAKERRNG